MTKFVLHGGNVGDNNNDNTSFFREMTIHPKKEINFLINCFACDPERIEDKFRRHSALFSQHSDNKNISFKLADVDNFGSQLKWADIVFLEGGVATEKLMVKLGVTKNFKKLLDGKTVGGSSAGANCLAKYYFGNESREIAPGLGVLNIKTFCHFELKDGDIVAKLAAFKEDLPIVALPNYKWVTLYN